MGRAVVIALLLGGLLAVGCGQPVEIPLDDAPQSTADGGAARDSAAADLSIKMDAAVADAAADLAADLSLDQAGTDGPVEGGIDAGVDGPLGDAVSDTVGEGLAGDATTSKDGGGSE